MAENPEYQTKEVCKIISENIEKDIAEIKASITAMQAYGKWILGTLVIGLFLQLNAVVTRPITNQAHAETVQTANK